MRSLSADGPTNGLVMFQNARGEVQVRTRD